MEGAGSHSAMGCTLWEAHGLSDNKQTLDLRVNSERGAVAPKGSAGEPGSKGLVEISLQAPAIRLTPRSGGHCFHSRSTNIETEALRGRVTCRLPPHSQPAARSVWLTSPSSTPGTSQARGDSRAWQTGAAQHIRVASGPPSLELEREAEL